MEINPLSSPTCGGQPLDFLILTSGLFVTPGWTTDDHEGSAGPVGCNAHTVQSDTHVLCLGVWKRQLYIFSAVLAFSMQMWDWITSKNVRCDLTGLYKIVPHVVQQVFQRFHTHRHDTCSRT